jgi:hypothetical protein
MRPRLTASRRLAPACALGVALAVVLAPSPALAALRVLIVAGLGGEPVYTREFNDEVQAVASASRALTAPADVRVLSGAAATRAAVLADAHALSRASARDDRFILYLIGHGSYDGRQYKFNLPGPDLSDRDIAALLDALPMREQLVVATGSSSGALLDALSRPHRVLITATRNGGEKNSTRFASAFAAALTSPEADTDKNGAISAREAYDYANRRVQDYFRRQTLLASEHAVLQGEDGGVFTVASLRPTAAAAAVAEQSGTAGSAQVPAALLHERAALNGRIATLEQRKGAMTPERYTAQLEPLLLQLAELQQRIDHARGGGGGAPPAATPNPVPAAPAPALPAAPASSASPAPSEDTR